MTREPDTQEVAHVLLDPGLGLVRVQDPGEPKLHGKGRKALFLDRDGVINVDHGYVHSPEQTQWVPGIFELCLAARAAGYLLVVITNQAGIARGHYSEQTFRDYMLWVHGQFQARGAPLAATYYCPHHPTAGLGAAMIECTCRKPKPGMILAAAAALEINLAESIMIGDSDSDMLAATAAGLGEAFFLVHQASPGRASGVGHEVHSLLQLSQRLGWRAPTADSSQGGAR